MNWIEEFLLAGFTEEDIMDIRLCLQGKRDLYLDFPDLFRKLCQHFGEEIPYGTMKFRDGDADAWIINRIEKKN